MKTLSKPKSLAKIMYPLTIILLFAIVSGCQNDTGTIDDQIDKIDFKIVILGEDQNESTVFAAGTDINVALKLINSSGKEFEWKYDYTCQLFQTENFLLVYKRNEGETNDDYIPIGAPYQSPINCQTINLPPQNVPPGETILIKLPWSTNPDNQPLSTGKYYIISNFALKINDQSRNWDLRTDFEM